jgi:hypothetical protein
LFIAGHFAPTVDLACAAGSRSRQPAASERLKERALAISRNSNLVSLSPPSAGDSVVIDRPNAIPLGHHSGSDAFGLV